MRPVFFRNDRSNASESSFPRPTSAHARRFFAVVRFEDVKGERQFAANEIGFHRLISKDRKPFLSLFLRPGKFARRFRDNEIAETIIKKTERAGDAARLLP